MAYSVHATPVSLITCNSKYWNMRMAYSVHATPVSLITCSSKYRNITICTCTTSFTLVSLDTPHSAEWEEIHASLIPDLQMLS